MKLLASVSAFSHLLEQDRREKVYFSLPNLLTEISPLIGAQVMLNARTTALQLGEMEVTWAFTFHKALL